MTSKNRGKKTRKERLLAQESFDPEKQKYRKEVEKMLEKQIRALRREKIIAHSLWIYLVILCTIFMTIGGFTADPTMKLWFGISSCFWLLFGVVFLLRYSINHNRIEIMKELKAIQLRIEELHEKINGQ